MEVDPATWWWWEQGRGIGRRQLRARVDAFIAADEGNHDGAGPAPSGEIEHSLGERLKRRRTEIGITGEAAARALHVNYWTYLSWETGSRAPTCRYYPAIIGFLGLDPWPAPTSLGDRLRAERLRRGLTLRQLSTIMGVDPGSLGSWEAGHIPRHDSCRTKLEAFLDGRPRPRNRPRRA